MGRTHWWGGQRRAAGLECERGWGRSKGCSLVHYPGVGAPARVSPRSRQSQVLRTRGRRGQASPQHATDELLQGKETGASSSSAALT